MTLRILVVDDENAILDMVRRSLSGDGHHVAVAGSLHVARACLEDGEFDLFIIDIGLSDGSGLDLVQTIRRQLPGWIIVLSGRQDVTDRVVALELGADDYIVKPFHLRELRARVQAGQRRLSPGGEPTLENGQDLRHFCAYTIDFGRRSVTQQGGGELHLTTREFDVLWALLSQNRKVVTREAIVKAAFGDQHAMGGRPVDGIISRLRDKLFPDGSGPQYIRTIHGRGYQISE